MKELGRSVDCGGLYEESDLQSDMGQMFDTGTHADFALTVNKLTYRLHKCILVCRCPKLLRSHPWLAFKFDILEFTGLVIILARRLGKLSWQESW